MTAPTQATVYSKDHCPYCDLAKKLLSERGITYTDINLTDKPEELIALKERTELQTVPQIFIGDTFIGGYTSLAALDADGRLAALLAA